MEGHESFDDDMLGGAPSDSASRASRATESVDHLEEVASPPKRLPSDPGPMAFHLAGDLEDSRHSHSDYTGEIGQVASPAKRLPDDPSGPSGPIQFDLGENTPPKESAFARVECVEALSKHDNKVLLYPMTVLFPESKVTAIMGPMRSGKTTFLNFLTGTISKGLKAEGVVHLPGRHGFVPADDRLHGYFTCRSYMRHYTRLTGIQDNFANAKLSMDLLISLGMQNHADTKVGDMFNDGLTTGQKRRLSVALEALSSPETLLLDEPTTGLDSESAYRIMKFLTEYAAHPGRRVIVTVHQPSSFLWNMIDNVVLLSSGKLVYQGPRHELEPFFARHGAPCPSTFNPADHYVGMINDEFVLHSKSVDDWVDAFEDWQEEQSMREDMEQALTISASFPSSGDLSSLKRGASKVKMNMLAKIGSRKGPILTKPRPSSRASTPKAVVELTKRYIFNLRKNRGFLGIRMVIYCVLSLLIGTLCFDIGSQRTAASVTTRAALLFYCNSIFIFMSVATVPFTVTERKIVEKEVRNGYYHPACYQLAQAVASIPATALLAIITTAIVLPMTGLRDPVWFLINMFLALTCAEAAAQLAAHVASHFVIAISLIGGIYGVCMLVPGFIMVPSLFPSWLKWLYYVPFHTYSWRSFMYREFDGDITFDSDLFGTGEDVLRFYELDGLNPMNDTIVLGCYAAGIHLISFTVLHLRNVMHNRNQVTVEKGDDNSIKTS